MALNIAQKKAVVADVAMAAASAHSAIAAEYRGMTVAELTSLRDKARENGVIIKVAKNTLVRRAIVDTDFECMSAELTGPLLYAFSMQDPGSAARVVKEFTKDNPKLVTRLVAIGGGLHGADELSRLAELPTLDQALAMLMGVMRAPIEKFVRTMAEPHTKMVRVVAAVRDSKEAA